MNAIVPFNFGDQLVRIEDRDGEPWFVLADVCRALEIGNASMAAQRLDDDERDVLNIADTIGRLQATTVINESGLWSLVLTSRKAAEKRFKKWVTSVVLPTVRRTGSYAPTADPILPRDPRALIAYLNSQAEDMIALEDANASLAPKAEAFERLNTVLAATRRS